MTTLATPPLPEVAEARHAEARGQTLEQRLEHAWAVAVSSRETECPVCESTMALEGARARCNGCGAELS